MDRQLIEKYLLELDKRLGDKGLKGSINIYGGSCLALVYDLRGSTKDIDAIFEPKNEIYKIAEEIAFENDLPKDWLNDGVKGFLTNEMEYNEYDLIGLENLKIYYPTAETMLAMKLISLRTDSSDIEDIKGLMDIVGIKSTEELISLVEKFYPPRTISLRTYYFIEELFSENIDEKQSLLDDIKSFKDNKKNDK
ncbi:DUF6036 family nucleotidyltransferase [uncultured Ezakiella sp.]|uniref:DUF6036 family nucleotidyltransferase n=1 Tax=uncultured Ezakiella sp. TaxID=1637529 RepID=UPI0025CEBA16|nr:DUF6036 family nucleotidyltransferase [uncultured Ezakiella sp.]